MNARDGVLVLSENTGAYEARGVGAPSQPHSTWPARHVRSTKALSMAPAERRRRREAICDWVREHDIERWIGLQLDAIDEARDRAGRTLETS